MRKSNNSYSIEKTEPVPKLGLAITYIRFIDSSSDTFHLQIRQK